MSLWKTLIECAETVRDRGARKVTAHSKPQVSVCVLGSVRGNPPRTAKAQVTGLSTLRGNPPSLREGSGARLDGPAPPPEAGGATTDIEATEIDPLPIDADLHDFAPAVERLLEVSCSPRPRIDESDTR